MKGCLSLIVKAAAVIAAVIAVLAFVVYKRFFAPSEFSTGELAEFCGPAYKAAGFELSGSDSIDKGGKTDKWMDSSSFCRLSTTPDRVRAFKDKLRVAHVPDPNLPDQPADIFSCEFYGRSGKLPEWWQGGDRPGAACYSIDESRGGSQRGVRLAIFEAEGLIFAERWHN